MNRRTALGAVALAVLSAPVAAEATSVNFGQASQGYSAYTMSNGGSTTGGGYNSLYYGQGAYADPGNNVWNGFGRYGVPGSTAFYGGGHLNSNSGTTKQPAGNPGNPYAFTFSSPMGVFTPGSMASGTSLFSPTNSGATNAGNATSAGTVSPVTLTLGGIDTENGAGNTGNQGTPGFLLSGAELVFNNDIGTFSLGNVPDGTYNLYLYGSNFDGTRGAAFTVSSGTALGGFTSTINPNATPAGPLTTYILGGDYVEFVGVQPVNGTISGTYAAVSNPISGLSGEGDFNGLQLVTASAVPEPATLGVIAAGGLGLLARRRRQA